MILFSIKHIFRLIMYEEMTRQLSKQYIFESLEHVTIKRSYNLQFFSLLNVLVLCLKDATLWKNCMAFAWYSY